MTLQKLVFAHVLLLQTWMSSTHTYLCSSGSHSEGECGTGIALLRWWGKTKSTPSLVTCRCKTGGCIGSIGCLGRKGCSDLSKAITALGGSGDKRKDWKGTHRAASAACSDLPREEWSPPHALAFCQPAPLSLLHTHTHILALSAKEFGNRYCNCVVSELVIDQLGVGLAYRSAGWQVQGRSTGRHACTHIPQRAPLTPSKERRVNQSSAGLQLLPYKALLNSGIVGR